MPVTKATQNVYIGGEENVRVWTEAEKKWGGSMSSLIMKLLKSYLEGTEGSA